MSEIIEIEGSTDYRLRVEYDDSPENPRLEWDMQTGFVKIEGRGDSRRSDVPAIHGTAMRIEDAHDHFGAHLRTRYPEAVVTRWAKIFHLQVVEYDSDHGGYWFVHLDENFGADFTGQAEIIKQDRATYEQWAEGSVYGVILEKRTRWVAVTESGSDNVADDVEWGSEMDTWDEVDSVWSCYLDDDYTALVVGREHFSEMPAVVTK